MTLRTVSTTRLLLTVLTLATGSLLLGACEASTQALREDAENLPGVIRASAEEGGHENDIPFANAPSFVTVWMEAEPTPEEVMAVFDSYDDDIDGGGLGSVEVILDGPKEATLSAGEDIHVTWPMVEDLVDAQLDDNVIEYRREAHPVLPGVRVVLSDTEFADVVAYADRYRDLEDIETVTVISGPFLLIRDEVNEDPARTAAREDLTSRVDALFDLAGAVVTGRGPLELRVPADQVSEVRELAETNTEADTAGRVVVRTAHRTP